MDAVALLLLNMVGLLVASTFGIGSVLMFPFSGSFDHYL